MVSEEHKRKESGIISRLPVRLSRACNACKNFGVDGKHFPEFLKRRKQTLNFWRENSKSKRSKKKATTERKKKRLCPTGRPYIIYNPPHIFLSLRFLWSRCYVCDCWFGLVLVFVRSSVPAQAVLAHDWRRDALLSYAAAVGAVVAVAATSRCATAAAASA